MDLLSYLNKNLQMLVILEGGTPKNPEKNPRRDSRTNKKLNPHIALGQKPTGTTLVGGERSPHWGIRPQRLIPWLTPSVNSLPAVNSPRLTPRGNRPPPPTRLPPWLTRTSYEKNKRSKLGRRDRSSSTLSMSTSEVKADALLICSVIFYC